MTRTACLVLLAFLSAACVSKQSAHNGALRFMNAVPDGPIMNMSVNGTVRALQDYGGGSAFTAIRAGTYTVKIAGLLPPAAVPDTETLFELTPDLAVNDELNFIVVGREANGSVELLQLPPNVTAGVPGGRTRTQFVHAAVGAPAFDAYVVAPDAVITASTPFASGLGYKQWTGQQDVTGGAARVVLTAPGDPNTVYFDSATVFLQLQRAVILAAIPNTGPDAATRPFAVAFWYGAGSAVAQDIRAQAQFRLVNASAGSYSLDVFLNAPTVPGAERQTCDPATTEETTVLELCAIPYTSVGPFNTIDIANYQLKVQKTGDANVVPQATTATFAPNTATTALVTAFIPDTATAMALNLRNIPLPRRIASQAQLRIIDTSLAADNALGGDPTTDRLELYIKPAGAPLADETADFINVRFGSDSGYLAEIAGSYDITLVKADTATPDAPPEVMLTREVTLVNGGIYTLLIADSIPASLPLQYISMDDDPT